MLLLLLLLLLLLPHGDGALSRATASTNTTPSSSSCPLDFSLLQPYLPAPASASDPASRCSFALQALHLLLAVLLRSSSLFLPPPSADAACWSALSAALSLPLPSSCGFPAASLSRPGCMNLSSRADFDAAVPASALSSLASACLDLSLAPVPACTTCTTALNSLRASFLSGPDRTNVTPCAAYPFIYAAAFNSLGPADPATAGCLFLLTPSNSTSSPASSPPPSHAWLFALAAGLGGLLLLLLLLAFCCRSRRRKAAAAGAGPEGSALALTPRSLESISASTTVSKFTLDEIWEATRNLVPHITNQNLLPETDVTCPKWPESET